MTRFSQGALRTVWFSLCLTLVFFTAATARGTQTFYAAPSGADTNPGTKAAPFATLERARDAVRKWRKTAGAASKPVTVMLQAGRYTITDTLNLSAEDSGSEGAPVVWQAAPGDEVRLMGGMPLDAWKRVASQAVLKRLPAEARGKVIEMDLNVVGEQLGTVNPGPKQSVLFFNQHYMTLARYPNEGWETIEATADREEEGRRSHERSQRQGRRSRRAAQFAYSGDRPKGWESSEDVWMQGYWYRDWSASYQRVDHIDLAAGSIHMAPPLNRAGYLSGQRFYFLNVLEELDQPGEWYLDRESATLYFWPPSSIDEAEVSFPVLERPMVRLTDASHIEFRRMTFECSRDGAITVRGGSDHLIAGCIFRNLGNTAVDIRGGRRHKVLSCDVYQVAAAGIAIDGGNRKTLERGDHVVENCHLHHFAQMRRTYQPGVQVSGVGQRVSHCLVHDCPHQAIGYRGNDHVVEYCDFTRIATETGDVGVLYTAMDWTYMGHEFRYNYFHNIHAPGKLGCDVIYPDLPCGGIRLYGNIFFDVDRVFHTNSGRGMTIENNLLIQADRGIHFQVWERNNYQHFRPGSDWRMIERLDEVPYDRPPYSTRYPALVHLAKDIAKGEEEIVSRAMPRDNIIRRNISWGKDYFLHVDAKAGLEEVTVEQNLICDPIVFVGCPTGDCKARKFKNGNEEIQEIFEKSGNIIAQGNPGIDLSANGKFQLKEDSLAWKIGFEPIPFDKIGLYKDAYRTKAQFD